MPVVLIPLHFDRDPVDRKPSAQRSIVLRPFLTSDFMTGMPVMPGSDKLPMNVSLEKTMKQLSINYFLGDRANGDRNSQQRSWHFASSIRPNKQAARHNRMGIGVTIEKHKSSNERLISH